MPNGWSSQAYVQGFDCDYITKKDLNIFERMEVAGSIYEVVEEPYYKTKSNIVDYNLAVHSSKMRGESVSSKKSSETSTSARKCRKGMYINQRIYIN